MRLFVTILAVVTPSFCMAQDTEEVALIKATFAELQILSIAENVEYCGYVGFDADGELMVSPPTRGDEGSCLSDDPTGMEIITASYHTHGGHSENYFNEVPSGEDMEGGADEGIDGYVATPGGRLWYIDSVDMVASQLCGIGCLLKDPLFRTGGHGIIAQSYTYDELVVKLEE